ncbi:MAG: peptide MFS transporter [Blastocatellia bacterium]|nr:peptide MFS transporter [Blastocatellia bacterium]
MSVAVSQLDLPMQETTDTAGLAGHPRGLTTLFFTEYWERFSYYGMRALLVLYMTASLQEGGLGFSNAKAVQIYGIYTASVYMTSILGGVIADQWLGARLAVLVGGTIIALGHFLLAFHPLPAFFAGMVCIALGTGFLKPNISAMVGGLYRPGDPRRDSGFSLFYIGINLGAMIAPLVCGTLGQRVNWHLGFAIAGVGMVLGLVQFVFHRERLSAVGNRPEKREKNKGETASTPLTKEEIGQLASVFSLFFFSTIFWTCFEQSGSSLTLFANQLTRNQAFGFEFPSSWFQSVNSVFILLLAPVFSWMWIKMGTKQPSSPGKFTFGLFFVGLGYLVMVGSTFFVSENRVGPAWLVVMYFLHTLGELCLSPVGLSTVTKATPLRFVGLMMGLWFVFIAFGNYCAGVVAGWFNPTGGWVEIRLFFFGLALLTIVGAGILAMLTPGVKRLAGKPL